MQFAALLEQAGFEVLQDGTYDQFAHRVDNSIMRDIIVARKPLSCIYLNPKKARLHTTTQPCFFYYIFVYAEIPELLKLTAHTS